MKIAKGTFPPFVRLCCFSSVFTAFSYASISMVYYFTNPEIERLARFLKHHALWNWVQFNFFSWRMFFLSVTLVIATFFASAIGLVSAIFAKVLLDRATNVLKSGLGA